MTHVVFCQLCSSVALARMPGLLGRCLPTLRVHVSYILCLGSQKEVIGSNAESHVAAVKHEKTSGNDAVVDLPGYSMGTQKGSAFSAGVQGSVPAGSDSSCPKPAVVRLLDLLPEAFRQRSTPSATVATEGAKTASNPAWDDAKRFAAVADLLNARNNGLRRLGRRRALGRRVAPAVPAVHRGRHWLEVARIAAQPLIAAVVQIVALRHRATRQFPGNAMGEGRSGLVSAASQEAVSLVIRRCRPQPTVIRTGDCDLRPESPSECFRARSFSHTCKFSKQAAIS